MCTKYKAKGMNRMVKNIIKEDNKAKFTQEYIDSRMYIINDEILKQVSNLSFKTEFMENDLDKPFRKILRRQGYSVLAHYYCNTSEVSYYIVHWNWIRHFRYITMLW